MYLPENEQLGFQEVVRIGLEHKTFVSLIKHSVDQRIFSWLWHIF